MKKKEIYGRLLAAFKEFNFGNRVYQVGALKVIFESFGRFVGHLYTSL